MRATSRGVAVVLPASRTKKRLPALAWPKATGVTSSTCLSWLQPGPWAGRHIVIPLDVAGGRLSYAISRERRRKARAAAEGTNDLAAVAV